MIVDVLFQEGFCIGFQREAEFLRWDVTDNVKDALYGVSSGCGSYRRNCFAPQQLREDTTDRSHHMSTEAEYSIILGG